MGKNKETGRINKKQIKEEIIIVQTLTPKQRWIALYIIDLENKKHMVNG
jgi:hypothetical protein